MMASALHTSALIVFCFFFVLVTLTGFWAVRWRRGGPGPSQVSMDSLEEWGLAGRGFGTLITWFLVGGDVYTAYTVIAVPAVLYGAGAFGFFAVPYCVLLYPYMMILLPRLWSVCSRHGYVTLGDFVRGRYGSRWLAVALAATGILATMPYIALQLVGMKAVIGAMGLTGEWPLIAAFVILAAYTYSSGLRAPAAIAIVKDIMLYIMVIAAVVVIPAKLGGFAHVFATAGQALAGHTPPGALILRPQQALGYSTLALGSALALMLYPHTATGVLSSSSGEVIRRNMALLPAYNILLGLIALLGFMALTAGIHVTDGNQAVPQLFLKMFPEWFAGFCLAAIAIGALVPAAIMSIAAANLFTRNIYGELFHKTMTPAQESTMAKVVSMVVKFGALLFVIYAPTKYAIELQLLGGIWIVQTLPAVVCGLYTRWFDGRALLAGWAVGMAVGTWMEAQTKASIYPLHIAGHVYAMYAAFPALAVNFAVAIVLTAGIRAAGATSGTDLTRAEDYAG